MDCIFCKIARGELPANKLYEDETALAILDINPIASGHTLLITKKHYQTILETPPEVLANLMKSSLKVIKAVVAATNAEGYNVFINNNRCASQLVPHLHFHIIPRRSNDGIHFHWSPVPAPPEELAKIAEKIKRHF